MKSIKFIVTASIAILFSAFSFAQIQDHSQNSSSRTETFKVLGNCDMCKVRIEKAVKINGVIKAEWNLDSKVLTLVYNPSVIKSDDLLSKVAAVGHDTERIKATDEAYNRLPGCCKYDREKNN